MAVSLRWVLLLPLLDLAAMAGSPSLRHYLREGLNLAHWERGTMGEGNVGAVQVSIPPHALRPTRVRDCVTWGGKTKI